MQVVDFSIQELAQMRRFFDSGSTISYQFRKTQLLKLRELIKQHEEAIFKALNQDLKKGPEESYATETGLVIAEINYALKRLKKWMRPKRVATNLLNFPATSRIYRDPLGVVLVIGSWNYPFQLLVSPVVGAIAGGNCVVLKPSEFAPATSAVIARLFNENFPAEYLRVIEGEGSVVVPAMMQAQKFDHIFYTGSGKVGREIYQNAAADLIPVTLELGGKSPAIVEKNADIRIAAKRIAIGKFLNAGQTCVAPDYVLVHRDNESEFLTELKKAITTFFGSDVASNPDYGRIINTRRFENLVSSLPGPEKIFWGGTHHREGLFFSPTIITGISMDDAVMQEEIFGPLLPVIAFTQKEEALQVIRKFEKSLSFYLFTNNKRDEQWWMERVSFGGGCINNTLWQLSNPNLPFGGVGGSGIGAYHGKYSFETFTHAKAVMSSPTWFDPGIKYPPLTGKLKTFKRFIK